jgi:hypothetical protein
MAQEVAGLIVELVFPKIQKHSHPSPEKMNVKPDLIETAISINEQMDNLNSAKLFLKEQISKDQYIKEPET